jgi:inosine/xanthosine triphosphatase
MNIKVGSKNQTKIQAVKDALLLYPGLFPDPNIIGVDVNIDLFGHPKSLKETSDGALKRAREAFVDCDFSFGLEGGLMEVPNTKTGFMEVGACAIYDGKYTYLGLSPAFEWPPKVAEMILGGKADASQAFKQLGFTPHEKLGAMPGGIVGFLTGGKLTREEFTKYSIIMALVQLERAEIY